MIIVPIDGYWSLKPQMMMIILIMVFKISWRSWFVWSSQHGTTGLIVELLILYMNFTKEEFQHSNIPTWNNWGQETVDSTCGLCTNCTYFTKGEFRSVYRNVYLSMETVTMYQILKIIKSCIVFADTHYLVFSLWNIKKKGDKMHTRTDYR